MILDIQPTSESVRAACEHARPDFRLAFQDLGAPWQNFVISPYAARATVLGASTGKRFYPHELRVRIPMMQELNPETAVWEGGTVPRWDQGVLEEPKYFSFFQDQPHAAFNPNHRAQWRAHELLHGAVGFFWHPEMTRFEFYVTARINEMLPVVHWYGFDEAGKARCDAHRNQTFIREYCSACESLALPYWEQDASKRNQTDMFLELAEEMMHAESAACLREIESGRMVQRRQAHLDPSSDAIGYLRGHWPRVTAWSFGAWVERFLTPRDYVQDASELLARSQAVYEMLRAGELRFDVDSAAVLAEKRRAQDLAYRLLLTLEWVTPGQEAEAEDAAEAVFSHLEDVVHAEARLDLGQFEALEDLKAFVPAELVDMILSDGFIASKEAVQQVRAGVLSAYQVPHEVTDEECEAFVASEAFGAEGRLDARFAKFSGLEFLEFQAWLNSEPRQDVESDEFSILPEDVSELQLGDVRPHQTLLLREFHSAAISRVLEGFDELEEGQYWVARVVVRGDVRVMLLDETLHHILTQTFTDDFLEFEDELMELLDEGFLVYTRPVFPSPQ